MKTTLIALAAASTLLSGQAFAEPAKGRDPFSPNARAWLDKTAEEIGREASAAPGSAPVAVRVSVSTYRFNRVELAGTSGSPEADAAVVKAARRLRPSVPPTELLGSKVTLRVQPGGALARAGATGSY